MPKINNPAKILKLWKKVQNRYGVSDEDDKEEKKKSSAKEKEAAKQEEKITKGLTVLKVVSRGGLNTPSKIKKFDKTHVKLVLVMKKYCKTLKSVKLEGAQDMNKLRKAVKQLTVVVSDLNYQQLSDDETDDADLNEILAVDTSTLDRAMDSPDFAAGPEDDADFDEVEETEVDGEEGKPPVPPPAPPPDGQSRFAARLKALAPVLEKAETTNKVATIQARAQIAEANKAFVARKYDDANAALDRAESLIKQALASVAKKAAPPEDSTATVKRLNALAPAIKTALAGPNKARVQALFVGINGQIKNGDHLQAGKLLDELEPLLKTTTATGVGQGLEAALAQWKSARDKVVESLKELEKGIRAMNDPDSDAAIVLVKAIQANLTPRPDSAQAVAELERYISTDQIVADAEDPNGFGIKIAIRSTLLPILANLRASMSV